MRICHLSDLHFGRHDATLAASLAAEVMDRQPDLVVVSGDFTQHGNVAEFREARAFLDQLQAPFLAVPGNHDVPAFNLVRRFIDPYGLYRRYIANDLEPFLDLGTVAIAGIKTSRRLRAELNWAHGSISRGQLQRLEKRFANATPGALRIVVAHHPLMHPEETMQKPMRLVRRADLALATFAQLDIRLVLSGHFHLSYVRRHGAVAEGAPAGLRKAGQEPILVAQAASTISTRLRGDTNAYNVIDVVDGRIVLNLREWRDGGWQTRETSTAPAAPAGVEPVSVVSPPHSRSLGLKPT